MHLAVGDTVGPRVRAAAKSGVLKQIVDSHPTPEGVIEAIFIRVLSRRPTAAEMTALLPVVAEGKPPAVYEDIFAGLLGSERCQPPNLGNLHLAYFWWLAPLSALMRCPERPKNVKKRAPFRS